ncbi:MAG: cytochrome c [Paracoccaceae bacterium]
MSFRLRFAMRLILPALALCLLPAPVLAEAGPAGTTQGPTPGQALFAEHCARCHGESAEGENNAPDIRGVPKGTLARALRGYDEMPEFALDQAEVAALHAWLRRLDPEP